MNLDTNALSGKLATAAIGGAALTLAMAFVLAFFVDPRLLALDWMVAAFLVGTGTSYLIGREKGFF